MNPVDCELRKKDLLGGNKSLRRQVTVGSVCGHFGKGQLCIDNDALQSRYGGVIKWRSTRLETRPTLEFDLGKLVYEWNYCLNKLSQMFCKLSNGGVMREDVHDSRKRNLETKEKTVSVNNQSRGKR